MAHKLSLTLTHRCKHGEDKRVGVKFYSLPWQRNPRLEDRGMQKLPNTLLKFLSWIKLRLRIEENLKRDSQVVLILPQVNLVERSDSRLLIPNHVFFAFLPFSQQPNSSYIQKMTNLDAKIKTSKPNSKPEIQSTRKHTRIPYPKCS